MPDDWEYQYNLQPQINDADDDNDGDGMTNFEEYLAGTSPIDATSVLRLEITNNNGAISLKFHAQPNKSYTVQFQSTLGGAWQSLSHIDAQPNLQYIVIPVPPSGGSRFYQLRSPRVP